jgi:hypothetical protein
MPYRCKRMGFKSAVLPSWEVLRVDGDFCRSFQLKNPTVQPAEVAPPGRKTSA